jgi:hypothetical protein
MIVKRETYLLQLRELKDVQIIKVTEVCCCGKSTTIIPKILGNLKIKK